VGGVDYITKPFQTGEVLARIETHLSLRKLQKQIEAQNAHLQQEIIKREQAEQQIRAQHTFLRTVLDSLPHPFYVINMADYTVEMANAAADADNLQGQITCYALSHQNEQPCNTSEHPCPLQEVKNSRQLVIVEHLHYDREGQARYVEVHGSPIFDSAGNVVQMIEYTLDITERKQAEAALRESEARWRSLTETSPDHILTLDTELNIQFANFAPPGLTIEELIGAPLYTHVEELIGTPLYTHVEEERQTEIKAILEGVLKTGTPARYETEYLTPDGNTIYYESRVVPRLFGSDKVVGLTLSARDITERKQIEVQRERLAALEERERIGRELHDDLGQVMSSMGVQAQAAQTLMGLRKTAQAQAILTQLVQMSDEANDDVRQYILGIRASERIPGVHTAATQPPPDFLTALDRYLDQLRQRYGLDTHVSWPDNMSASPLAPEVETQLLRIIQESLTNVRKHAGVENARLLFTLHTDEVQVVIEDDGRGFDPSPQGDDALHRTSPSLGETEGGLIPVKEGHFGLEIMRERAEAVDGSLEVRSSSGEGTQVIVHLPRVLETSQEEAVRGLRVLLVDDHPLYLEGLRNLLSARGVQVIGMAHDGLKAQELARKLRPNLILMDVEMPRCNGLEAARRIKAELPDIKIVMLTVAAEDETLFEALKSGASGYLLKSLNRIQFFNLLAEVMRGETVLSPTLAGRVLDAFKQGENILNTQTAPASVPSSTAATFPELTPRQGEILTLVAQGLTYKEIGAKIYISEAAIKYHMGQILERLQLRSRREAAMYAQRKIGHT